MKSESNKLVIFDFDGTITKKDTMLELAKWHFGALKFYLGILKISPQILLYKLKIKSNSYAKEAFLTYFFQNLSYENFKNICEQYSLNEIDKIIKPEAAKKIEFYKNNKTKMIIISASVEEWVKPWAFKNGFTDVISSKLEVNNNKITGKLSGKNCYGIEKVNYFEKKFGAMKNYHVVAFGDSAGDREILAQAQESYYKKYE